MAYREFTAPDGENWEAWEVQPTLIERRVDSEANFDGEERRSVPRRRAPVAAELRGGWLVFQSANGKCRLAPFPSEWAKLAPADLWALLERARNAGSRPD